MEQADKAEYDRLSATPGTHQYKQRTEYLRAAGFTSEADARERQEGEVAGGYRTVFQTPSQDRAMEHARLLRQQIESIPDSREKQTALTKLDECEMWLGRAPR